MPEERVLTVDELLNVCNADGIPIGGAKVKEGCKYDPYYMSGSENWTELRRVGTWFSPDASDEVTVYALVTSSSDPTDDYTHVESWVVRWVADEGDRGTYYDSYVLPYPALKKYFQRWIKEQRQR